MKEGFTALLDKELSDMKPNKRELKSNKEERDALPLLVSLLFL